MIGLTVKSTTTTLNKKDITVVYNLKFRNAFYELECYKDGYNKEAPNNYCYIEELTDDEGEAEAFLQLIKRGKVFPVHIKEISEDFFRN